MSWRRFGLMAAAVGLLTRLWRTWARVATSWLVVMGLRMVPSSLALRDAGLLASVFRSTRSVVVLLLTVFKMSGLMTFLGLRIREYHRSLLAHRATRVLVARGSRERSPHRASGSTDATTAAASTSHPVGTRVVICALQSRPQLRGAQGTVLDFDLATGRYRVELVEGKEKMRVKADNLKVSIFS